MHRPPVNRASMPANATRRSGSPAASGTMVAAIMAANEESGPSTRMRLGPKMAYAISGKMVAYRP